MPFHGTSLCICVYICIYIHIYVCNREADAKRIAGTRSPELAGTASRGSICHIAMWRVCRQYISPDPPASHRWQRDINTMHEKLPLMHARERQACATTSHAAALLSFWENWLEIMIVDRAWLNWLDGRERISGGREDEADTGDWKLSDLFI